MNPHNNVIIKMAVIIFGFAGNNYLQAYLFKYFAHIS